MLEFSGRERGIFGIHGILGEVFLGEILRRNNGEKSEESFNYSNSGLGRTTVQRKEKH